MKNMYTTEEMADLWEDIHEIENMMGRRAFSVLLRRDAETWEKYWCRSAQDPTLGSPDGYYVGYDSLNAYFAVQEALLQEKAKLAKSLYPQELEAIEDEKLSGVGTLNLNSLSTPVIEVARDRQSAKGLWYCMDHSVDDTRYGRIGQQTWGRLAVDFVRENGAWKIWHVYFAPDFQTATGTNWADKAPLTDDPRYASLADFAMPQPDKASAGPVPQAPEPYDTFTETFSYGI